MQRFINNWAATLTAPATSGDLTLSVEPALAAKLVGLGSGDHYVLTLAEVVDEVETSWEIVKVTAVVGGVLTVERGKEGTGAYAWSVGASISARATAGSLEELRSAGAELGDNQPLPLGPADSGAAERASREDHVHPLPSLAALGAASAEQGSLAESAVQPAALATGLAGKVDKVTGLGLSQESFTTAEKTKLAGLDGPLWKGTFPSLAALQAAHPTAEPGASAHVDAGLAEPVQLYIWDDSDGEWIASGGEAAPVTAAQVKTLYESNPDTNAYTDAEKSKLAGVAAGATANADTDTLAEGATNKWFTTARVLATVLSGLSLATGGAITSADTVLVAFGKLQKQITDLITTVNGKQDTLVSATNIKTVNGSSLLGSGDLSISGSGADWGDIGGTLADQTDLAAALATKAAKTTSRTITGTTGTLIPSDAGKVIICTNAGAVTLTVQLEASGAWDDASVVHILQTGAGVVTVADGSGITVNVYSGLTKAMRGQYGSAALIRTASDTFVLSGTLGGTPA